MSRYVVNLAGNPFSTHGQIIRRVGKNQRILDVGCNEGYIGRDCDPSNVFYGIDYDQDALTVAQKHYAAVARMDLNASTVLPWETTFDTIIFADILEHLLQPQAVFQTIVRGYLKPGGTVILSLPNVANWQIRLKLLFGDFHYQDTGILDRTHLHLYTFQTAKESFLDRDFQLFQETGGSNVFGRIIHFLPWTRRLLAHSIILHLRYQPTAPISSGTPNQTL